MMIKETELEAKYTDDEYQEHIQSFNVDAEATEERFHEWVDENIADLKRIYIRRVMDNEDMAVSIGLLDWSKQMFIAWDYNQKKQAKIDQEMKEMMGEV
jgi:hypothetical protein